MQSNSSEAFSWQPEPIVYIEGEIKNLPTSLMSSLEEYCTAREIQDIPTATKLWENSSAKTLYSDGEDTIAHWTIADTTKLVYMGRFAYGEDKQLLIALLPPRNHKEYVLVSCYDTATRGAWSKATSCSTWHLSDDTLTNRKYLHRKVRHIDGLELNNEKDSTAIPNYETTKSKSVLIEEKTTADSNGASISNTPLPAKLPSTSSAPDITSNAAPEAPVTINFVFRARLADRTLRCRPYSSCNTVKMLFSHALGAGIITEDTTHLAVALLDQCQKIVVRDDEHDFQEIKDAIEQARRKKCEDKARDEGAANEEAESIEVVVTPIQWCG